MKRAWLNVLLRFSGIVNRQKQKLLGASGLNVIGIGVSIMLLEAVNILLGLPAYIFLAPEALPGAGITDSGTIASYRLRRIVSLSIIGGVIGAWALKILIVGSLGFSGISLLSHGAKADALSWDFNRPTDYVYDTAKVQVADGMALFRATMLPSSGELPDTDSLPPVETPEITPEVTIEPTLVPSVVATPTPLPETPAPLPATPAPLPTSAPLLDAFRDSLISSARAQSDEVCTATIQPLASLPTPGIQEWSGFTEIASKNGGTIDYQISGDGGLTWQFWNGSDWTTAGAQDFNDAATIDDHIAAFGVASAQIMFRARFTSDCTHDMQLLGVSVTYEHAIVPVSSVYASFTFDEGEGSATQNGVALGAAGVFVGGPQWTNGVSGAALEFEGPATYVTVPDNIALTPQAGITLSAWVRMTGTTGGEAPIITKTLTGLNAGTVYKLYITAQRHPAIRVSLDGTDKNQVAIEASQIEIQNGEWRLISATYDTNVLRIYIDGMEVASRDLTGNLLLNVGPIIIAGGIYRLNEGFVGTLDNVTIETSALSANEIKARYDASVLPSPSASVSSSSSPLTSLLPSVIPITEEETLAPSISIGIAREGERLAAGSRRTIQWSARHTSDKVSIYYSKDNFQNDIHLIDEDAPNTGSFVWTVPDDASNAMRIKITDAADELIRAVSPAFAVIAVDPTTLHLLDTTTAMIRDLSNTFSVAFKIEPGALTPHAPVLDMAGVMALTIGENSTSAVLEIRDNGGNTISVQTAADVLTPGVAHVISVTYDGVAAGIYVDGLLVGTGEGALGVLASETTLTVGADNASAVTVWGYALTSSDAAEVYLGINNMPPVVTNVTGAQQPDGFVHVTYTLADKEANIIALEHYEYSLTGAFNGEEKPMTEAKGDTASNGVHSLTSSAAGTARMFVWDARADLGNTYAKTVFVRIGANDGIEASEIDTASEPFAVDTGAPQVTRISAEQSSGSDIINITAGLQTAPACGTAICDVTVEPQVSFDDGATWSVLSMHTVTLGKESGETHITWNAAKNENARSLRVRIKVTDVFQNTSDWIVSEAFATDTQPPFGMADFTGAASDADAILWSWSPVAAEASFDHYEIWYGADRDAVQMQDAENARVWSVKNDADMGITGTNKALIAGLAPDTAYTAIIVAVDRFGHRASLEATEFRTQKITGNGVTTHVPVTVLPAEAYQAPEPPHGGFSISLEGGARSTTDATVSIQISAGADATSVAISNFPDLHDAIQQPIESVGSWNICCQNGTHTVYAKFYNDWGQSSPIVKDTIIAAASATTNAGTTAGVQPTAEGRQTPPSPSASTQTAEIDSPILATLQDTQESAVLALPSVEDIRPATVGNEITFRGRTVPNAKVVLFIHSDQVVVYQTRADENGTWNFTHSQDDTELAPGEHTVFAVTHDPGSRIKSRPSPARIFHVTPNRLGIIRSHLDLTTTIMTLIALIIGAAYIAIRRLQGKAV